MKRKKRLLYVGIGIVSVGISFFLYSMVHTSAPQKKVTLYPTQYSDTHITKNAMVTDRRFNDLAVFNKENLLAGVAGSLGAARPSPESKQPEKGTWLWTPTLTMTPVYWNSVITSAKKNGIHTIYLSIDTYLDIYVMPDGPEKEKKKEAFDHILESFIATAHKNNITVDAEAGWRNWAEPGNEYKAFAIVDYVVAFNATHAEKFRGFQYDIEPYLLSSYAKDKKTVLRNFVNLVNKTTARLGRSDVAFSVVIPDFYDGPSGETPRFLYGWNYNYTLNHLLNVLERRPSSQLIVMAYRNQSGGTDGSIDISRDEILTANDYHTKIIVAQETGDVSPPSLTFYRTSLSSLNTEIQNIQEAFAKDESYHGIAIHYINTLMELK